ncbi:4-oxalocrotonate tautomerase [Pseudomonas putida]|uniref:4-oxalocrotonate tautomerase n=1 Tax=Pseudomonas putida TaxID=303 RepID=UPI003F3B7BFA
MPSVRVELSPGRSREQKARFVEEVTKVASEVLKCPAGSVEVIFIEIPPSDWARGGSFLAPPPGQ